MRKKHLTKVCALALGTCMGFGVIFQCAHALELRVTEFTFNGKTEDYVEAHCVGYDDFKGTTTYSSEVYGIPLPSTRYAEMSIPYHEYKEDNIEYIGGTFGSFPYTVKESPVNGVKSYVFDRDWNDVVDATEWATFRAYDEYTTDDTTKTSWGTGVGHTMNSNATKTLKIIPE